MKVLAISDTHGRSRVMSYLAENYSGDLFLHGGDFTRYGREKDFIDFLSVLDRLQFRCKVVIAGNHEIALDRGHMPHHRRTQFLAKYPCKLTGEAIQYELRKRSVYLVHEAFQFEGIRIFGSPFSASYSATAFQYKPEFQDMIWQAIPPGLDILLTHSPPQGILDSNSEGVRCGSARLTQIVKLRKPKYHLFGHIHESAGVMIEDSTTYVNLSNKEFAFTIPKSNNAPPF